MPELPDLQVFSRNLDKALKGKKVKTVSVPNSKKLNSSVAVLKKALEGAKVQSVVREGKELHINFSNKHVLGLHMMLRGQLYLFSKNNEHKYPIIELLFYDGSGLTMTDFQGAATPKLDPPASDVPDALKVTEKTLKATIGQYQKQYQNFFVGPTSHTWYRQCLCR